MVVSRSHGSGQSVVLLRGRRALARQGSGPPLLRARAAAGDEAQVGGAFYLEFGCREEIADGWLFSRGLYVPR